MHTYRVSYQNVIEGSFKNKHARIKASNETEARMIILSKSIYNAIYKIEIIK